jgi:ferredoxin
VHAFGAHVRRLADEFPCLTTHIRYSHPSAKDVQGEHYDSAGHVDVELLKSLLPLDSYDYYLCGPTPFMESLFDGLKSVDVADERIHYEFFGPGASLRKDPGNRALIDELGDQQPVAVRFARSGIQTTWNPSRGTLLDLAESEGLQPAYSCRSGICQTCATKVSLGEIAYVEQPMIDPGECTALICSAYPRPNPDSAGVDQGLVLDL